MIAYTVRYISRHLDSYFRGSKHKLALVATLSVFFGIVTQLGALAQGACPPGLTHYFAFDEKAAGTYADKVTNISATCTNCPEPADSRFAGGQRFNGSNTGAQITDIEKFEWNQHSNFTMEVWVQVSGTSTNNRVIVGRASKNTEMSWWLGIDPQGYAVFDMRDNAGKSHTVDDYQKIVNLNDGKWHHVAVVREGIHNWTKLYVDGFRVDDLGRVNMQKFEGSFESASPVSIGYLDVGSMYRFNGVIDEFRVYNRNLSESEMRAQYDRGGGNYCGSNQFAPEIVSTPIPFATVGQQYIYEVKATGNPAPGYTLVSAPPGMRVDFRLGSVSWVPTDAGTFTVELKASNSAGDSAPQRYQITVRAATEEPIGILHHWTLNESGGNRFADVYTPIDAVPDIKKRPASVKGAVGTGQRFNGRDTGLDVIGSPNFDWKANESFTIELWLRTETREGSSDEQNQVLVGRHAMDSPSQWWLGLDKDRKARFYLPDIGFNGDLVGSAGPKLNDGIWHQVVAVRDGSSGTTSLYVDGAPIDARRFYYENEFASRSPVSIGYFNAGVRNSFQYEGDMDEVKLFGRALSAEEIRERFVEVYNNMTEILSFTGRYAEGESFNQKIVILDWRTLYELDTDFFAIERSEDGIDFTDIGQVKASGTTTAALDYTYTDATPLKEQGYYRLRLVRIDGTYTYSNIIMVQDRSPIASSFRVYPNPATTGDEVTIEVANLKENEDVSFTITDVTGKLILTQQVKTDAFGELKLTVPIGGALTGGIYNLTVAGSNKTLNRKLVVSR